MAAEEHSKGWEVAHRRIEKADRSRSSELDLSGLGLTAIPDSLVQLNNLRLLSLKQNQITVIPDSITQLANLKGLFLSGNQIKTIPDSLAQLANLEVLDLGRNQITTIPDSLAQFSKLLVLDLTRNQITIIPDSFGQLAHLKALYLDRNPLPAEILAAAEGGAVRLFRYLESTATRRVYPRTIKLVLLGEPKSGKTTLLDALKGNPKPCDPSRQETIGVDVVNIEKPHPRDRKPMYLSVWDFAGQHIEHATHQFFLTENAIYLILWNARQGTESGKRDLWYWLELLKMRVREPKFLLVATHTEHTPPDLNLTEIERSYTGGQGHFPVDLDTLAGFAALQAKILELAAGSPSLRAEWPADWLPVRDKLRGMRKTQPHMTPDDLRRLMSKGGVTDRRAQQDLAHQLHDLGEILYFQERDELSSLVIVNPQWVSELIAVVVRSQQVRRQNGILRKTDLDELWKERQLQPEVRRYLIRLMDWFDLTYSTRHPTELGIVVEALPYPTPEDLKRIDLAPGRPQMEMIYRFPSLQRHLPPGIPTWGIARAHRFSTCTPWRNAAAFCDADTNSQALILASDSAKEVRLRVASDFPPFFFGQIQAILLDTFKRYPGAEPERRFPCPCRPDCSYSYLYEVVLKRRQQGKYEITCGITGEDVPLDSLLTGFPRPASAEGLRALASEMRRRFTVQLRGLREQMEKTCPSVFTLVPSRDFRLLETWVESATRERELELVLYCENESDWHTTPHSLYRFSPDQEWFDLVKKSWNRLAGITRHVGPLAKTIGKAAGVTWPEIPIEKLPETSTDAAGKLSHALGERDWAGLVDIETRHLLEQLIQHLDSQRPATEPKNGGLHPYVVDDGRLLWLCPDHQKQYRTRTQ